MPVNALNVRRRSAVRMRMDGNGVDETARQCEMAGGTVISAHKAYLASGWSGVDVTRGGRRGQRPCVDQVKMVYALWSRQAVPWLS